MWPNRRTVRSIADPDTFKTWENPEMLPTGKGAEGRGCFFWKKSFSLEAEAAALRTMTKINVPRAISYSENRVTLDHSQEKAESSTSQPSGTWSGKMAPRRVSTRRREEKTDVAGRPCRKILRATTIGKIGAKSELIGAGAPL